MERSLQKKSKVEHRPPTTNNKHQTSEATKHQTQIHVSKVQNVQFVQKVFTQ
jgi:hypothetical protein